MSEEAIHDSSEEKGKFVRQCLACLGLTLSVIAGVLIFITIIGTIEELKQYTIFLETASGQVLPTSQGRDLYAIWSVMLEGTLVTRKAGDHRCLVKAPDTRRLAMRAKQALERYNCTIKYESPIVEEEGRRILPTALEQAEIESMLHKLSEKTRRPN